MENKKCIYCGEKLTPKNVFMYKTRIQFVDKCERCTDKLEQGYDMYP